MTNPVQQMIDEVGGVAVMARALDVKHTSVIGWRNAKRIPAARVPAVARLTGLPFHAIRPDLFDAPAEASA